MNITIICPFYYPNLIGGAEVSIKMLAEWLASNDFNVQVVSFDGRTDSETINKVKVRRYPLISTKGLSLTLMYPVLRAMQKFEGTTDLYHVYDAYPAVGAGLYKTFKGKRQVVATLDNYAGFCPVSTAICSACDKFPSRMRCLFEQTSTLEKPLGFTYAAIYPLLSRLARKVDKYIAVSNTVAELYTKYGFNSEKIVVIPNFIDIESMKLDRTKSANKKFNILYVGAVSKHKGVDLLIQAFKIIESARPYLHLTLVGRGKWLSYCQSLVKKLQIEDKVTFTGYVDNQKLREIYSGADVFVHPARWNEPFGITLLEALSYGIPCIVSDKVSPEIVGEAGLVFKHENAEDLADKLMTFIVNEDLQDRLRHNCDKVLKRYDIDLVASRIANVYYDLVKN